MPGFETIDTTCCIVGGGPAGVMLGYLLARQGVPVTVLEKHNDFFRDFRGDTVHPSTLEVFHELGLLDDLLKVPHQQVTGIGGVFGDFEFQTADFSHVPGTCKFVALMPQWDFLNFLSTRARQFPHFDLRMQHEAYDLYRDNRNRVVGVNVRTRAGAEVRVNAALVVACDGRHSLMRKAAHLNVREFGVPIDVLWFHIARKQSDPERLFGNINYGQALILINRGDYFQAGLIVRKGSFPEIQSRGIDEFRNNIARIAPYLSDRVGEIASWDQIKLLTVQINRLEKWHDPGLLCIGDAAHAMSPAGGVGINLAIQDAVASANLLAKALRRGAVPDALLAKVQKRRELPTRITQALQVNAHRAFEYIFEKPGPIHAPWQLKVAVSIPGIQRVVGYTVGIGIRPEHVPGPRRTAALVKTVIRGSAFAAGMATGIVRALRARRALPRFAQQM